ncbi:hypothetical protein D1007_32514 [Hordeum vulgare]|nr:hypothetical protein D1007_32514 [Hordeum vulgare]
MRAELRFRRRPERTLSCPSKSACVHTISLLWTLLVPEAVIPTAAVPDLENSLRFRGRSSGWISWRDGKQAFTIAACTSATRASRSGRPRLRPTAFPASSLLPSIP